MMFDGAIHIHSTVNIEEQGLLCTVDFFPPAKDTILQFLLSDVMASLEQYHDTQNSGYWGEQLRH